MSDPAGRPPEGYTLSRQFRQPLIVTGANHRYARSLCQFLRSAQRHGEDARSKWLVYDLGLSSSDRDSIKQQFPWVNLKDVEFADYPPHVALETGSFAWKPILFHEAVKGHHGPAFWFDSATVFRRPLTEPLTTLDRTGVWTLKGQTPLMGRADSRVISALDVPPEILHLPERVAGAVGFDTSNTVAVGLLERWAGMARNPTFILPEKPDPRHRYDQTLLSALLLTAAWKGEIELGEEEVDISSVRPMTYLTTRNKLWPRWPAGLDALGRAWYHGWKAGDRLAIRLQSAWNTLGGGLQRFWREHFRVEIEGPLGSLIGEPAFGYYADPFPYRHGTEDWLFAERFDYARNRGRLVAMNLARRTAIEVNGSDPFSRIDCHASFPFLIERDDGLHMIPETCERRTVDLYACKSFPAEWKLKRRLLADIDAVDSMVLRVDGLDYLFTSVREGAENRHLAIFFSDDIASAPLHPHPMNDRRLYADCHHGTGRCGGYLDVDARGRILRFMQNSKSYYGEGGQWMEITALSPTHFSERPLPATELPPGFPERRNSHHLSHGPFGFAWDIRDRVRG